MERNARQTLMAMALLLALLAGLASAQYQAAMCVNQMALASQACSVIPKVSNHIEPLGGGGEYEIQHEHRDGHGHKHGHGHEHGHGHGHGHGREHDGEHRAEEDCCRWLKEVDKYCVCDLLLHLPKFLTKPKHAYKLRVGNTCDIIFKCEGM